MTTGSTKVETSDGEGYSTLAESPPTIQVVGTALFIVLIVLLPHVFTFAGRTTWAVLLALLAVALVWKSVRSGLTTHWSVPAVAWLVLVAYGLAIVGAEIPRYALEAAIPPLLAVALFVLASAGLVPGRAIIVGAALAGAALGLMILADFFAQVYRWSSLIRAVAPDIALYDTLPYVPPRARITPGLHANVSGALMYVASASSFALIRMNEYRGIGWLASIVMLLGVVATGSRGAFLGIIVVGIVAYLAPRAGNVKEHKRRAWVVGGGVATITILLGGLWLAGIRPDFLFRSTFQARIPVVSAGFEMFLDSTSIGHGPGAFRNLFPLYAPDLYPGASARLIWTSSHNGYVQSLLEVGWVGGLFIGTALVVLIMRFSARVRSADARFSLAVVAGTAAIAGFLVHSFVDAMATDLLPLGLLTVVVGGAVASTGPGAVQSRSLSLAWLILPVVVVPLLVLATFQAHRSYLEGLEASQRGEQDRAVSSFREAFEADRLPVYAQALSQSLASTSQSAPNDPMFQPGPFTPTSIALNQAAALIETDAVEASELLDAIGTQIRGDEVALVQYGGLRLELGDVEDAIDAFSQAIRVNPWLVTSPFLSHLPDQIRLEVLDRTTSVSCDGVGALILGGLANDEQLAEIGDRCSGSTMIRDLIEIREGLAASVLERNEATLLTHPDSMGSRRIAGIAALELGHLDRARLHLAHATLLGDPVSAGALRGSYGTPPPEVNAVVSTLAQGYSPVQKRSGATDVYKLQSAFMAIVGRREPLPSPLSSGLWQQAHVILQTR